MESFLEISIVFLFNTLLIEHSTAREACAQQVYIRRLAMELLPQNYLRGFIFFRLTNAYILQNGLVKQVLHS